jgi:hypothetical protein
MSLFCLEVFHSILHHTDFALGGDQDTLLALQPGEEKIDLKTLSGSQIISLTWLQCKKRILISPKSKVRVVKYAVEHFQAEKRHVADTTVRVQSSFVKKVTEK